MAPGPSGANCKHARADEGRQEGEHRRLRVVNVLDDEETGPARASPATSARAASAIAAAVAGRSDAPTAKRSGSEPVAPSSRSTDSTPTASSHPASGAYATPSP